MMKKIVGLVTSLTSVITKSRAEQLREIRESMERRDDYMSMPLPRSFANTVSKILKATRQAGKERSEG